MKKKILLMVAIMAMLICVFAISVSAATETIDGLVYDLNSNGTARLGKEANKTVNIETLIIPEKVTAADGREYTVTEVYEKSFNGNTNIKYLSLPSTITFIGPAAFQNCTNLQFVDFNDNQNDVNFNNWGTFMGCSSLKAVSLPDKTDYIINRIFSECKNLEAVYLPSATTNIESNGYGNSAAFSYCHKMYFVNEPFDVRDENGNFYGDNFVMPERPEVYFFPSNLEKLYQRDSGVGFFQCYNLNPVMVMPTTLTKLWINDGTFYECGATGNSFTIVLLGDMTDIRIGLRDKRATGVSYVLANPADKTLNDVSIVNSNTGYTPTLDGSEHIYFCHSDKYFKIFKADSFTESNVEYLTGVPHFVNPNITESTKEDCVTNRTETTYCFCGVKIGTSEVENTKLGHEYDLEKGAVKSNIEYTNYLANGTLYTQCARCEECQKSEVNPLIADFKGFSTKEVGDGLTFGYTLNLEAIEEYEAVNSTTLEFGFVVAVQAFLGDNAPLDKDGNAASNNVIKASITSEDHTYTGADFRLTSASWDGTANINGVETALKDIKFYMAGYILDGASVVYINSGATGNSADAYSYRDIAGTEVIPEETPAE